MAYNKAIMRRFRRLIPIFISIVLLIILVFYAPWPAVFKTFSEIKTSTIILLVGLSILYYVAKSVRFWFMMRAIKIYKPFWVVTLSYMSAQPVTLLPGGEIYRSKSLREYTGVPIKRSISQFTAQGVLEGMALAVVAFISVMTVDKLRLPFLLAMLFILIIFFLVQHGVFKHLYKPINALPFVSISQKTISDFSRANQAMLSWKRLPLLLGASIVIEIIGVAIAYVAVASVGGEPTIIKAVLLYVVPLIVSFISLLPGGFGVAEQSGVAIMALSGASTAVAVAATLVMRITIVAFGVLYGVLVGSFGKFLKIKSSKIPLD